MIGQLHITWYCMLLQMMDDAGLHLHYSFVYEVYCVGVGDLGQLHHFTVDFNFCSTVFNIFKIWGVMCWQCSHVHVSSCQTTTFCFKTNYEQSLFSKVLLFKSIICDIEIYFIALELVRLMTSDKFGWSTLYNLKIHICAFKVQTFREQDNLHRRSNVRGHW